MQNICGSCKGGITKGQHSTHVFMEITKEMGVFSTFHQGSPNWKFIVKSTQPNKILANLF